MLYGSDAIAGVVRVLPQAAASLGGFGGELIDLISSANNRQGAGSLLLEGARLRRPGARPDRVAAAGEPPARR